MPSYAELDREYASRLAGCPPDEDGPILMVNFMKYRDRADYGADRDDGVSGREADDRYAPREILAAIGAEIVFFGDVEPGGQWDRVGIVRYPSRAAFLAMNARPDFQERHVHKAAGMSRTIVCGTLPDTPPPPDGSGRVLFELVAPGTALRFGRGGRLRVEGTILGDGRRFATLGVAWIGEADVAPEPSAERVVAVVRPETDRLAAEMRTVRP
jgi:hypothetical protein